MADRCYRIWFRDLTGRERYEDVRAWGEADTLRQTRELRRHGEWVDRWQALVVPAGCRRPRLRRRLKLMIRARFPARDNT